MADSLLCLLRWPEESRRLTAKKKKLLQNCTSLLAGLFGFFSLLVLLFFIFYFIFFVFRGKGMKLRSQLSSSTDYNPCIPKFSSLKN